MLIIVEKGVSLPINTIIIVVIAVIVLIALIAMFSGVFSQSSSSMSLEAATKAACQNVNPSLCISGKFDIRQARTPVKGFDANKNGKINDAHYDPTYNTLTTYCIDDNLETLCGNYYGCDLSIKTFSSVCRNGVDAGKFIITPTDEQEFYDCCIRRVCNC